MTKPIELNFVCHVMLWNAVGLALIGSVTIFGAIEGVPAWSGVLLVISGVASRSGIGKFLRMDISGTKMYRLAAVLFAAFCSVVTDSIAGETLRFSWLVAFLAFVGTILISLAIEAYIRERIAGEHAETANADIG